MFRVNANSKFLSKVATPGEGNVLSVICETMRTTCCLSGPDWGGQNERLYMFSHWKKISQRRLKHQQNRQKIRGAQNWKSISNAQLRVSICIWPCLLRQLGNLSPCQNSRWSEGVCYKPQSNQRWNVKRVYDWRSPPCQDLYIDAIRGFDFL